MIPFRINWILGSLGHAPIKTRCPFQVSPRQAKPFSVLSTAQRILYQSSCVEGVSRSGTMSVARILCCTPLQFHTKSRFLSSTSSSVDAKAYYKLLACCPQLKLHGYSGPVHPHPSYPRRPQNSFHQQENGVQAVQ